MRSGRQLWGLHVVAWSCWSWNALCVSALCPTVLVTGSTDGIGVTTAKNMALAGYTVLLHGRNAERIQRAETTVRSFVRDRSSDPDGCRIFSLPPADISTVEGATKLAKDVEALCDENALDLTVLMNNAGVYEEQLSLTPAGLEVTFAVNVLAPFVITSHLLPRLLKQKSRIVTASSISQCSNIRDWDDLHYSKRSYSAHTSYSESKLLDAMLTVEMADRFQQAGIETDRITCNCLDPGTVNTKMLLAGWGPCGIDVEDALDQTWLCTTEEVDNVTGGYFNYKTERKASSSAYDIKERDLLWSVLSSLAPEAATKWKFDSL